MRANRFAAALVAWSLVPACVVAQAPGRPDPTDLQMVLDAALYPVQIMAFCYREVDQNRDVQMAGVDWVRRNSELLGKVEAMAKAAGVPSAARLDADRKSLDAIRKVVGGQADQAAYCKLIASLVDAGSFDLAIRDDLQQALKRIFPGP